MVAEELKLLIRAESSKAVSEMKKTQRQMNRTHKSSQNLVKGLLKQGAAWAGAAASIGSIVAVLKSSVSAFREQEEASQKLSAAVERNPLLDESATERLQEFADSLSDVTTVSDQTIESLAAQAAASGKSEEQIRKMVIAAADVAAVMDMDVQQAFENLNATFTGTAGELEDFVPALGDMSEEALRAGDAVNVIAEEFDGAAEAIARTESGQLTQFKNSLVDVSEALGRQVLQNINGLLSGLTGISGKIAEIIEQQNEVRAMRSGTAAEGRVTEEQYQRAQREIEFILELEERRNKLIQRRRGYLAANQNNMAEMARANIGRLNDQITMERERYKWAFELIEAYERQAEESERASDSTGNTAEETERAAGETQNWMENLRNITELLGDAGSAAEKLDLGDTSGPIQRMFEWERAAIEQRDEFYEQFHQNEIDRIMRQKDLFIQAGVDRAEAEEWAQQKILQARANQASQWLGSLQGVMSQASGLISDYNKLQRQQLQETLEKYDERMEKMRERHENELEYAKERGASERELQAIKERQSEEEEALEEKRRKEQRKVEKRAFQREKAMRIASTTMAGAQAFVNTLATAPFPANIGFAATIAAMTAAQVATISAQEYPGLASGGIVPAQGESGGLYRLGDKGKAETVVPFDIRDMQQPPTVQINGTVELYGAGGKDEFIRDIDRAMKRRRRTGELV